MSYEEDNLRAIKTFCLEDETAEDHAVHVAELEAAYAAFQARTGYNVSDSNPAPLGESALDAALVVTSEDPE